MDRKLLVPIVTSTLLITSLGLLLNRSYTELIVMFVYVCLFELFIFLLINKNLKSNWTYSEIRARFKNYLTRTAWFQILLFIYFIVRISNGIETELLFFYSHVIMMFYAIGYILCVSNIALKEGDKTKEKK